MSWDSLREGCKPAPTRSGTPCYTASAVHDTGRFAGLYTAGGVLTIANEIGAPRRGHAPSVAPRCALQLAKKQSRLQKARALGGLCGRGCGLLLTLGAAASAASGGGFWLAAAARPLRASILELQLMLLSWAVWTVSASGSEDGSSRTPGARRIRNSAPARCKKYDAAS